MEFIFSILQGFFLIPIVGGSVYGLLCLLAVRRFRAQSPSVPLLSFSTWPPVSILKPVRGLEKNLKANLYSACLQDYPDFQVVFSVQDFDDPAIPLLKEIQREHPERVSVAVENIHAGPNGKINNLLGALRHARHNILVISDSDVHLEANYLKSLIAPLADPQVGFACTLYRAISADRWFEKMELLTLNADFVPSVVFAYVSGASRFCLGSSVALRRSSLEGIGGLEALADYLAEDYEMGKRLWRSGKKMVLVPYWVDIATDLKRLSQWWNHQVSWDQKTRAASPAGFFATIVIRSVPFALLFATLRLADSLGLAILGGALGLRLGSAAGVLAWGARDREGLKSLALLPLRDMAALISWVLALTKKTVVWRDSKLILTRDGRLARRKVTR
ncbi:MAG TPA: bacteriohopanetetrol glucosamine biosynthesis glycosyltransferase HpnI [Thermodesulfobacteriota bacterium]|nr:bacteriohopanetetrol glucosamine biosynthesis glycosyltransferase HpnI [Thermodesulfobacteriota bacterium]